MTYPDKNFFIQQSKRNILDKYSDNDLIEKSVIVLNEKLFKEDSGFGIYHCQDCDAEEHSNYSRFYITGFFVARLVIGQSYTVKGTVITYKSSYYEEKEISVTEVKAIRPVGRYGIIKYLQSIKGLKNRADKIYDLFGESCIDVLINSPEKISESIHGVGKKSALNWAKQLEVFKDSYNATSKLLEYGLTINQARKLYDEFKDDIIIKIEENPYFLAKEVRGYGFKSSDRIARSIGYDFKSKFRIREAIIFTLEEASLEGHCFQYCSELVEKTKEILSLKLSIMDMVKLSKEHNTDFVYKINSDSFTININKLNYCLEKYYAESDPSKRNNYRYILAEVEECDIILQFEELKLEHRIVIDIDEDAANPKIYLSYLFVNENKVAKRVIELSKIKPFQRKIDVPAMLNKLLLEKGILLEERQKEAVITCVNSFGGFYIINGPAGSGKTFVLKIIIEILSNIYKSFNLDFKTVILAPTGKAAKVAQKSTSLPCSTIHKKIGYAMNDNCKYNAEHPLKCDLLVLDESSMVDITLCRYLLEAIKNGTKVIFLGDTCQLPSVGPGNVLKDLINSEIVHVVTLNVAKRQSLLSGILKNATKILNKEMISSCYDTNDAFVLYNEDVYNVQKLILKSVNNLIVNKGYNINDIQVLCPQKTSSVGTYTMNYLIQKQFNIQDVDCLKVKNKTFDIKISENDSTEVTLYFKKGDKVIHIKNNYNVCWYKLVNNSFELNTDITYITNGETGVIYDIIKVKNSKDELINRIIVKYDDGYVFYEEDNISSLDHSYALTIHKSQGSQWKAVVIPIVKQNYLMLDNNLFYTAYTRAEETCVTIGQYSGIQRAINNTRIIKRCTNLTGAIEKNLK
ncbi:AAA family ATPase [Clostridium sp.]|uniref:AAA family ATPase n=1 Tax=Clostridium sp. TaxID=1506 RepID=UPI001B6B271E|nr:AAA family ATPase [Clostridium sp.]MBP3914982.1 AAA family ATPase [Clostridium sp.]